MAMDVYCVSCSFPVHLYIDNVSQLYEAQKKYRSFLWSTTLSLFCSREAIETPLYLYKNKRLACRICHTYESPVSPCLNPCISRLQQRFTTKEQRVSLTFPCFTPPTNPCSTRLYSDFNIHWTRKTSIEVRGLSEHYAANFSDNVSPIGTLKSTRPLCSTRVHSSAVPENH